MQIAMRIVIQNWLTKKFLTEEGTWTLALARAKTFCASFDAYHYCEEHGVENSQVVLQFARSKTGMNLPAHAGSAR
jgi:hypothetical protein